MINSLPVQLLNFKMLQYLLNTSSGGLILIALGSIIVYNAFQIIFDPLRDIPGPFLARFTRLWYLLELYKGKFEITNIELHKKYGAIVRIAPNQYSIDDVESAKTIYGHGSAFVKVSISMILQDFFLFIGKRADGCLVPLVFSMANAR